LKLAAARAAEHSRLGHEHLLICLPVGFLKALNRVLARVVKIAKSNASMMAILLNVENASLLAWRIHARRVVLRQIHCYNPKGPNQSLQTRIHRVVQVIKQVISKLQDYSRWNLFPRR
jgi:hypothetical protein